MQGVTAAQKRREKAKRLLEASISVTRKVKDETTTCKAVDQEDPKAKKRKLKQGEVNQQEQHVQIEERTGPAKSSAAPTLPTGTEKKDAEGRKSTEPWCPKSVYSKLPSMSNVCDREEDENPTNDFDLEAFLESRLGKLAAGQYANRVEDKALILSKTESLWKSIRKRRQAQREQQKKPVDRKQTKRGIQLKASTDAYEKLLPLNRCWVAYIRELMASRRSSKRALAELFHKVDLHGAIAVVARAACPTLVGIQGIVARETVNAFVLCSLDGKFRTVAKNGSTFHVTVQNLRFELQGDSLTSRWE